MIVPGAAGAVVRIVVTDEERSWGLDGHALEPAAPATAVLEMLDLGADRTEVRCRVIVTRPGRLAIELVIDIPYAHEDREGVFVPGILLPWESDDGGLRPRLDLGHGIWLRADRLPQVGVVVATASGVCRVWSPDDSPRPIRQGLVYGIGVHRAPAAGLRLTWRYPQREAGHLADATRSAIVGKRVIGVGEERSLWADAGASVTMRCTIERASGRPLPGEAGALARRLWGGVTSRGRGAGAPVPDRGSVDARLGYIARRHWDPVLGQYASPDGSGVAMAGFVEMSLGMAIAGARLRHLGAATGVPGSLERDLTAVDRWVGRGDPLMPWWFAGTARGRRRAYDRPGSPVAHEPVVEPIRTAVEARHLVGLARQLAGDPERALRYRTVATATAQWLLERRTDGRLPGVVGVSMAPGVPDASDASAFLVSLLADLAVDEADASVRTQLLGQAIETYEASIVPRINSRRFGGVTLDAESPDREAAVATLDAALALYEATADRSFLDHGAIVTDTLLSWVMAYRSRTFAGGSDAADRWISTLGASLVSSENQHLDPFPVGTSLVRYGLVADDRIALTAGRANIAWCVDGRWATDTSDGVRQSEQLLHTRWHYDAWATERGDVRAGIPWTDGVAREHGWPQVLPLLAMLEHGHITLDWPTGRTSTLPGLQVKVARASTGYDLRVVAGSAVRPWWLLRILRPPAGRSLTVGGGQPEILSWPRSLVAMVIDGDHAVVAASSDE